MPDENPEDCESCVKGGKILGIVGIVLGLVFLYMGVDVLTNSRLTTALSRGESHE